MSSIGVHFDVSKSLEIKKLETWNPFTIVSSASPSGNWGHRFYFSKTLRQHTPALPLHKNNNPSPFALSPLRFPSGAHVSGTHRRELQLLSICSACAIHEYLLLFTCSLLTNVRHSKRENLLVINKVPLVLKLDCFTPIHYRCFTGA